MSLKSGARTVLNVLITVACLFGLPDPVRAQQTAEAAIPATATPAATVAVAAPPLAGNAEAGRERVYTCTGCHGIPGYRNVYPSYRVPKIHGQSAQYISTALAEYRNGKRKHPTMRAQGESLSDQDIADIAAYLSSAAKH